MAYHINQCGDNYIPFIYVITVMLTTPWLSSNRSNFSWCRTSWSLVQGMVVPPSAQWGSFWRWSLFCRFWHSVRWGRGIINSWNWGWCWLFAKSRPQGVEGWFISMLCNTFQTHKKICFIFILGPRSLRCFGAKEASFQRYRRRHQKSL